MQHQFSQVRTRRQEGEVFLPDSTVTVGGSWSKADSESTTIPMSTAPLTVVTQVIYRLDRLERHGAVVLATISASGTHKGTAGASDMSISISGTSAEEFVLDLSAGRVVRSQIETKTLMDMPQMGMTMPMRMIATKELVP